jgi:hypothetical protein
MAFDLAQSTRVTDELNSALHNANYELHYITEERNLLKMQNEKIREAL